MPAGNDAQAAYAELTDKFGGGEGRAEDMIDAARERYPTELRTAQLSDVDTNATLLLEDDEVAEALGLSKGSEVVSKAVRGRYVVAVVKGPSGRTTKHVLERSAFDVGEEEKVTEAPIWSSDAAEAYAQEKDLTPEVIAQYVDEPEGSKGTYTKKDVAKAAEARAAAKA